MLRTKNIEYQDRSTAGSRFRRIVDVFPDNNRRNCEGDANNGGGAVEPRTLPLIQNNECISCAFLHKFWLYLLDQNMDLVQTMLLRTLPGGVYASRSTLLDCGYARCSLTEVTLLPS